VRCRCQHFGADEVAVVARLQEILGGSPLADGSRGLRQRGRVLCGVDISLTSA
jgi:hypothetical protein